MNAPDPTRHATPSAATTPDTAGGLARFFAPWRGSGGAPMPPAPGREIVWSWLGALIGIGAVAACGALLFDGIGLPLLIGSYGASAVLLFGASQSPLAQPRNLLGGHLVSAVVGVLCWQLFHDTPALAQALAVASAIAAMQATRTLHPPGGATALIATLGTPEIVRSGWLFVPVCGVGGPVILLLVALTINNLAPGRRYPVTWR